MRWVEHISTARGQHRQRLECTQALFSLILWLNLTHNSNIADKTQAGVKLQTQSAQRTPLELQCSFSLVSESVLLCVASGTGCIDVCEYSTLDLVKSSRFS